MTVARAELWVRARALDALATGVSRGPRARALARRLRPVALPLAFDHLTEAPGWVSWSLARRRRLARIAGAVMSADRLQRLIDGRVLGEVGAAIGEGALDAVLGLPAQSTRPTIPTGDPTPEALEGLGGSALLQDLEPALARRLVIGMAEPSVRLSPTEAAEIVAEALRIEEAA